jgi:hypothetical protein
MKLQPSIFLPVCVTLGKAAGRRSEKKMERQLTFWLQNTGGLNSFGLGCSWNAAQAARVKKTFQGSPHLFG